MGRDTKNEKRQSTLSAKNPPKKQKTEELQSSSNSKKGPNQKPQDPRRLSTVEQDSQQVFFHS